MTMIVIKVTRSYSKCDEDQAIEKDNVFDSSIKGEDHIKQFFNLKDNKVYNLFMHYKDVRLSPTDTTLSRDILYSDCRIYKSRPT